MKRFVDAEMAARAERAKVSVFDALPG